MTLFARVAVALALVPSIGCAGSPLPPSVDAGPATRGDAAVDPCATDASPRDTAGCNGGFLTGVPGPRQLGGPCTSASASALPAGSCEGDAICTVGGGLDVGRCEVLCDAGSWLVATGGCPTGTRCHRFVAPVPICLRDCDAAHACPAGLACDQGRCLAVSP